MTSEPGGDVVWRLEATDWNGPSEWRWRLLDGDALVAEHQVALDPGAWQVEAFADLYGHLRWRTGPDLLDELGDWIAQQVLGPVGAAVAAAPRPVRMELPAEAAVLGHRPWELARIDGRTLVARRVRVVAAAVPHHPLAKRPVGDRVRMLAVFGLPDGSGALNLRRERFELARLVRRIAKAHGTAIELRVLQYGATREGLREALLEEEGWDVVHLSGVGLPAGLVLEDDAGRHDTITSTELVDLLDLAADRVTLVTLSACESAAVAAAEHLEVLGLGPTRHAAPAVEATAALPAVAAEVASRLDCAVLAMRYPVVDEFAIDLAGSFYDQLLGQGHPVAAALASSLAQVDASGLSTATPALFGRRAVDLTLTPPEAPPVTDLADRMAEFPAQPPRFVGRVGPLTRAAAALAPESGRPAVVLHGMAGAGKTACATELAYTHQQSFAFVVWFAAPPDGTDIRPALSAFALATERQIPGLKWIHLVEDTAKLQDFLRRLTEVVEHNRILLVIDNAESLLTDDGRWRDQRWGWVVDALTAHEGLSRLLLTTRRLPAVLPPALVEPVNALSPAESVLLARELPGLRALIDDGRHALAVRVLRMVQGHPKLLELADGVAADPEALSAQLDAADRVWLDRGTGPQAFPGDGEPGGSDSDYAAVLAGWARSATAQLPPEALLLLQLICGLEEADRGRAVLATVWPLLWEESGRPVPAPAIESVLPILTQRALLAPDTGPDATITGWRVHPGVADTTRTDTDPGLAELVDTIVGNAWLATLHDARHRETEQLGGRLLRAARSAAPYLLRRHRWADLDTVAVEVLARDRSVGAAAGLAPLLEIAAAATRGTDQELALARTHARTLLALDPTRGTALLHHLLDTAATGGHHAQASSLAGDLINRHLDDGRYDQALDLADRKIDYTRRAGYGPWTQLADQAQRLQIQRIQGHTEAVLDEVDRLRARMADLPAAPDRSTEVANPWNVRETILSEGAIVAGDLGRWERALELNAENLTSKQARDASALELARAACNDYAPLVGLGRLDHARDVLMAGRTTFESADDTSALGRTLSALAGVEHAMEHLDRAIDLERDALRYKYAAGDPDIVAVSHHNVANYLGRTGTDPAAVAAHRSAAALICYQTGSGNLPTMLSALGRQLTSRPDRTPESFSEVCRLVEQVPGVDLAALVARFTPDGDTALRDVLDAAATTQIESPVAAWEPALSALHAAATDPEARTALDALLAPVADTEDWRVLVAVLRRIHDGERDPATLLPGLDDIDTAIARRALDVLDGTATVDADAWRRAGR